MSNALGQPSIKLIDWEKSMSDALKQRTMIFNGEIFNVLRIVIPAGIGPNLRCQLRNGSIFLKTGMVSAYWMIVNTVTAFKIMLLNWLSCAALPILIHLPMKECINSYTACWHMPAIGNQVLFKRHMSWIIRISPIIHQIKVKPISISRIFRSHLFDWVNQMWFLRPLNGQKTEMESSCGCLQASEGDANLIC